MNLVAWLVAGAVIGWLATLVTRTEPRDGLAGNIVGGITGALLAGWLASPLVGGGTIEQAEFGAAGLLVSVGGAIGLLGILIFVRRRTTR